MDLRILGNNRRSFYQWDVNQFLILEGVEAKYVHYENPHGNKALCVETIKCDGQLYAPVPNELLHTEKYVSKITAYIYDSDQISDCLDMDKTDDFTPFRGNVIFKKQFRVERRQSPDGYPVTQDQLITFESLAQAIRDSKAQLEKDYSETTTNLQSDYNTTKQKLAKDYSDTKKTLDSDYTAKKNQLNSDYNNTKETLTNDINTTKGTLTSEVTTAVNNIVDVTSVQQTKVGVGSEGINEWTITYKSRDGQKTFSSVLQVRNGKKFTIDKSYTTVSEMNADSTQPTGTVAVIGGSTEVEQAGQMYVYDGSAWQFIADLSGKQGIQGPSGTIQNVTATVDSTVGTPNVSVEMGGTPENRTFAFNFTGMKGETGEVSQAQFDTALSNKADVITNTRRGLSPLVCTDSDEEPFLGMTIFGKTEQKTTEGNQLLDWSNDRPLFLDKGTGVISENFSYHSITIDVSTLESLYVYGNFNLLNSINLRVGFYSTYPEIGVTGRRVDFQNNSSIDVHDVNYVLFGFYPENASLLDNIKASFQVNKGTIKAPYEPYTGGKPSPSPEYPQEIVSAGASGSIETKVAGKNLIPFPYIANSGNYKGVNITVNDNGSVTINGTASSEVFFNLSQVDFGNSALTKTQPSNGKYVISGHSGGCNVIYDQRNHVTFINILKNITYSNVVVYPQIEVGSEATSYEPYKPIQTATASTPNGLDALGEYSDEIDYSSGKKINKVKTIILNETASIGNVEPFGELVVIKIGGEKKVIGEKYLLCDKLSYRTVSGSSKVEGIGVWDTGTIGIFILKSRLSTIDREGALGWLKEHPLKVKYIPLAEPIVTDIPKEEMDAYHALHSNNPTTTVWNEDGTEYELDYRAETKRIVKQMARDIAREEINPINAILNGFMGKCDLSDPSNSYAVLPNGVLIQWGNAKFSETTPRINFKRVFKNPPTAFARQTSKFININDLSKYTIQMADIDTSRMLHWFAIGQDSEV